MNTIQTHTEDTGVLVVTFDHPERSVNTLGQRTLDELDAIITRLENEEERPVAVIFASAKPGAFITGADLFEMSKMNEPRLEQFLCLGQGLFERIAKLSMPTVAAINGTCLGGGMELALACTSRVAADDGSINLGLPESKLGILPAWGGTTRVTEMLGPARSLPMILAGKTMPPRKAQRAGLIDEVVRPEALPAAARRLAARKKKPVRRPPRLHRWLADVGPLRDWLLNKAQRDTDAATHGNYPAAEKIIDIVRTVCTDGHEAGLQAERDAVMALATGEVCQNLMRVFFLRQSAKRAVRDGLDAEPTHVEHAAVIGGGVMGAGIVHALVKAGVQVRLFEVNDEAAGAALGRVRKMLDADRRAKRLSPHEADQAMRRVSPTTNWSADRCGLKLADIVIEAAAEKMDVKRDIFAKLDDLTRPDCVLATNTSSLSVAEMARATADPSRVIGLHFFNPVPKMPLVEVVRAPESSDRALAMGVDLAQRIGKTVVLTGDAPGFLVNRVLIPYLAEALVMAAEGAPIDAVDLAMKKWGMPMGPFELLDQVGLDVAGYILQSLRGKLGEHIAVPDRIGEVVDRGWLGRKSGKGFYTYGKKRKSAPKLNTKLAKLLSDGKTIAADDLDEGRTQTRLVMPVVNEAARLLDEGVVDSADLVDLATVLGLGFAPFRGGLVRFAETFGLAGVTTAMTDLADRHGPRFTPCDALGYIAAADLPMQAIADRTGSDAERSTQRSAASKRETALSNETE